MDQETMLETVRRSPGEMIPIVHLEREDEKWQAPNRRGAGERGRNIGAALKAMQSRLSPAWPRADHTMEKGEKSSSARQLPWLTAFIVLFFLLIFLPLEARAKDQLPVFVTIPPQAYLVDKICGTHCDTHTLIGEGVSPHAYEPTPRQVATLSAARIYFTIGLPIEKAVIAKVKTTNKSLVIIATQKGIATRPMEQAGHDTTMPDPHIWLDPQRAIIIAQNIAAGLTEVAPQWSGYFATNLQRVTGELSRLDQRIRDILLPLRGKKMYVFHPAFGYFTDAYGLIQVAIEEEGKEPSPRHLAHLLNRAKQEHVKAIFVQPQFSPKGAQAIAHELKAEILPLNPLAYDYLSNLETMARLIRDKL